jgi:hypothetical protein
MYHGYIWNTAHLSFDKSVSQSKRQKPVVFWVLKKFEDTKNGAVIFRIFNQKP